MALSYYYDDQIRRYVEQVQRVFSNFKIFVGRDNYGNDQFYTVPCVYGDTDRTAQHIMRNNSENTLLPVPVIAVSDTNLQISDVRRQNPNHVDKRKVYEREYDQDTGSYTQKDGSRYQVDRYMPVPYDMTFQVDVWYTQTDHKLQICEQIMTLFNPDIDIQTSTNPLDWTALTTLTMKDITWNGRGVPVGIDDGLRITSFTFDVPIWINPPAKIKKQKIIHQIITDIYLTTVEGECPINNSLEGIPSYNFEDLSTMFDSENFATRSIVTPGNHYILVEDNVITLLGSDQNTINPDTNSVYSWRDLIEQYDNPLIDNLSMLRLRPVSDIEDVEFDYIGRIRYHPEENKLYWAADLETIPQDTLNPIDAIINPDTSYPGGKLPVAAAGQRYIIGESEIRSAAQSAIWSNIVADINDIIEYNGAVWSRVFDASEETGIHYTTNTFSGKKLKFDGELKQWSVLPDGIWKPGYWRLILGE